MTVYNRFRRWTMQGIWRRLFLALVEVAPREAQLIDSTTAKTHRSAAGGKRGDQIPAIGRSRGGRTTKIHAVVDVAGWPIAFEITPGQLGNVRAAMVLLAQLPPAALCAADTAYESDGLRQFLIERGTLPAIPNNPTPKWCYPFNRKLCVGSPRCNRDLVDLSESGAQSRRHQAGEGGLVMAFPPKHR